MALSGSYQDFHLEMFKDGLSHELQQKGTLLAGLVTKENVGGLKTHFTKVGKLTSYEKTQRGQLKNYQDATFERRIIDFKHIESDILVDGTDVLNMVSNPQNDYAMAMRDELGRQIDEEIALALSGNASVTTNGTTANVALPSGSKVVVANHAYDSGSGDVGLTPGKLKAAISLLGTAYVDVSKEDVFCVGPMKQLMKLATYSEVTSDDFRNKKPLNIPGVVSGINGYLGMTYVAYEGFGVDGSSDELVYVFPRSAIKLGIRQDLTVKAAEDFTRAGNPTSLSAWIDLGAVRMYEEKVIQIACDPTTL